ncbi:exodeoxyribonuclease VII small subunit [Agarilytica rhodophyticola]|uniref:exodeoxyribonuclease VII small subunit n=1 Tax=Agarilytica rhodophyticola TaxID=1737490 RepID=UPI000B343E97|nr:exodeoxyribonuclease VII small subunit [Agarilytica rhodophyticola]
MSTKKTLDFEKSLQELEGVVQALENGDLSLEESLKTFESGIKLTRTCQAALQEAEQRVNILLEQDGEQRTTEFDTSSLD